MEARIQRNMAQAAKMEEKRKEHFWQKKAHHEALRHDLGVLTPSTRLASISLP